MTPKDPQPWDRQPGENEQAWTAFIAYRDMGPGRTVSEAYRQKCRKPHAKQADGTWNKWVKKFRWAERATAWDNRAAERANGKLARIIASKAEWWAAEAEKQAKAGLEVGVLLREKAKNLASFPEIRVTTTETKPDAAGKPALYTTIVEPMDPRDFAAAARVAREAEEIVWKAVHGALGLARESDAAAGPPPANPAVADEAARRVADLARKHRETQAARRNGPPVEAPAGGGGP